MELQECLGILETKGDPSVRRTYLNSGAKEPLIGVKMGDLRLLAKTIKIDHALALALYASGIHDAMLLAGMVCDEAKLTRETLELWISQANCPSIAERCVAPLVAPRNDVWEIADAWANSQEEMRACAGFAIYGMLFSYLPDQKLDLEFVKEIIENIESRIKREKPYLQYAMNNCLIMAGIYIHPLSTYCLAVADRIGYVKPTLKINNCNIQSASDYIKRYAPRTKMKSL